MSEHPRLPRGFLPRRLMAPRKPHGPTAALAVALGIVGVHFGHAAHAINPQRSLEQYIHEAWRTDEGLPQNSVMALLQTRNGYLWLGTEEGLVRFDGVRFTVFDTSNTAQITRNGITALHEDRSGALWIGTFGGGLLEYRRGAFHRYSTADGLSDDRVRTIHEDRHGNLWIGTENGLSRMRKGRFTVFRQTDGLPGDAIRALAEDGAGDLWIGTREHGLSRFHGGRFENLSAAQGLPDDGVRALLIDRQGRLWVGTSGGGLASWEEGRFTVYTTKDGMPSDLIWAVHEDRNANIWVATSAGVIRLPHGRIGAGPADYGLGSYTATTFVEDREGSLWIGTLEDGLHRLRDGSFAGLKLSDGARPITASTVYESPSGTLWIGTKGGLYRVPQGASSALKVGLDLPSSTIHALREDRQGNLWIGTDAGIAIHTHDGVRMLNAADGLNSGDIWDIAEDTQGGIWLATTAGLQRFHQDRFTRYGRKEGLPGGPIFGPLYRDREGTLWVGTAGGGVLRWDGQRFHSYTTRQGLSDNFVTAIYEATDGTLWVGTQHGLNHFRRGRFVVYTRRQGLPADTVFAILEDLRGDLWFSSNQGVFRLARADLNAFERGEMRAVPAALYTQSDGMPSSECSGVGQPSAQARRDGTFWFVTVKGLALVDAGSVLINRVPPAVVIEDLWVEGSPLAAGATDIAPDARSFELKYTALSLVAPRKVRFRYRLEGFDRDWVDAGGRRSAFYTNLPPRKYRFHVLAANNDGIWNETGAIREFRVLPHFYRTPWFAAVCCVSALLLGLGFHRFRVQIVEARAAVMEERNRIAQDIHDGLAQYLAGIMVQLDGARLALESHSQAAALRIERARGLADLALDEARRSIWALTPRLLEEHSLVAGLKLIARYLNTDECIEVDVDVQGPPERLQQPTELALLRVAQEALHNAFKHGEPRRVVMTLIYRPREVELRVTDDGRGGAGEAIVGAGSGLGLRGMRERISKLKGRFTIESERAAGTEVRVVVPRPWIRWPISLRWLLSQRVP